LRGFSASTEHEKKEYKLFLCISLGFSEKIAIVWNLILLDPEIADFKSVPSMLVDVMTEYAR